MLIIWRFMFYLMYKYGMKVRSIMEENPQDNNHFQLVVLISIPAFANLFALYGFILIGFRLPMPPKSSDLLAKGIIIVIAAIVMYSFNQYLTTKKRRKAILKEFGDMSKVKKWFLFFASLVYLVASVWLFFYIGNIIIAKEYLLW